MKIILKGSNDIYLNGDFFQNKWKSTKMQEKPKNSKKIQEDENGSPSEPNNTLQVVIFKKKTPWMKAWILSSMLPIWKALKMDTKMNFETTTSKL